MDITSSEVYLLVFPERLESGDYIRVNGDSGWFQMLKAGVLYFMCEEGWGVEFPHLRKVKLTPRTRIQRREIVPATAEEIEERIAIKNAVRMAYLERNDELR